MKQETATHAEEAQGQQELDIANIGRKGTDEVSKENQKSDLAEIRDKLIKRYGTRKAFEWFVRAEDWRYQKLAESNDERYWKKTKKLLSEKEKETAALIAGSTAVSLMAIVISFLRYKSPTQ